MGTEGVQMAGAKPPYPPQFRIEAVRLVKDSGRPVSRIAAELGVRHETLRRWVRQGAIDAGQREGLIGEERERKTGVCSVASCRNLV